MADPLRRKITDNVLAEKEAALKTLSKHPDKYSE